MEQNNFQEIIELLTNVDVERRVLRRAFMKASTYGQDINLDSRAPSGNEGYKVNPYLIVDIYRDIIIPLTKDVEVRYLYHRVGKEPPIASIYFEKCRGPLDAFNHSPDMEDRFRTFESCEFYHM